METAARRQLEREGFAPEQQKLLRSLDLRYRGQAFELKSRSSRTRELAGSTQIEADFHAQHRGDRTATRTRTATIELVNARLTAYGLVPKPAAERHRGAGAAARGRAGRAPAGLVRRARPHDCPVWERERLPERRRSCSGPAIVEEFGATTVVPPGWRGALDAHGNLRFEREARA